MVIFSSQAHHSTYECEVSHKPPWTLLLTYGPGGVNNNLILQILKK